MSTASCRAAASPRKANNGFDAEPVSSCQSECSRACSGVCSWSVWRQAHAKGELQFFSDLVGLKDAECVQGLPRSAAQERMGVYAKRPFAGPAQVLAYLARYTHRVAIANSRLLEVDDNHVSFRWKDYRENGDHKGKVMRLDAASSCAGSCSTCCPTASIAFATMACSPTAIAPTSSCCVESSLKCRPLTTEPDGDDHEERGAPDNDPPPCPCCGGRMRVIETFDGPLSCPYHVRRFDSS